MEEERNLRVRFKEETINDVSSVEEVTMVRYISLHIVTKFNEKISGGCVDKDKMNQVKDRH